MTRLLLGFLLFASYCQATAGLAEWEIKTPGGNTLASIDPWKATQGTIFKGAGQNEPAVGNIEWWQYYPGSVAGLANKKFFLVNEGSFQVQWFEKESDLTNALHGQQPIGGRQNSEDGYRQAWAPLYEERCKTINDADFNAIPQAERELAKAELKRICDGLKK